MNTLDFRLNVKALEDSGAFIGKAAVYGERDLVDDIIEPGAFTQAIAQQGKGYPLLWAHRQDEPIGIGRIEDSKDALIVHGQLLMNDPAAQRAYQHMKAGTVKGLSIGFTVPRGEGRVMYRDDDTRILKQIHLHEISVVAVPAAPKAQITEVKSVGEVRRYLKSIQTAEPDAISELHEIGRELKRLLRDDEQEQAKAADLANVKRLAEKLKKLRPWDWQG